MSEITSAQKVRAALQFQYGIGHENVILFVERALPADTNFRTVDQSTFVGHYMLVMNRAVKQLTDFAHGSSFSVQNWWQDQFSADYLLTQAQELFGLILLLQSGLDNWSNKCDELVQAGWSLEVNAILYCFGVLDQKG